MSAILTLIDTALNFFFFLIAVVVPLIDSQAVFPRDLYPDVLVDVMQWLIREFDHYLIIERPRFYVGIAWLVVLFLWPLSLFNLFGFLRSKSWYSTTCLMFGVSFFTSQVTILFEVIGSGKASDKMIALYVSVIVMGILATLRGLLPLNSVSAIARRPR